jgi:orotidine-5'-phosphate decarboxylase
MNANTQILRRMETHDTLLCCGLDPDITKFPREITTGRHSDEEKILSFLCGVVDVTAKHVCCYKAQKAFFDALDLGHSTLKRIIQYIHSNHPEIPVIVDCKIGDIANTMDAYLSNIFGELKADGILLNPYMGDDAIVPAAQFKEKAIVVLVKTSNPSSSTVQDVPLHNGKLLWQHVLDLVVNRWNFNKNVIPVIASTTGGDLHQIRSQMPDEMLILLAGVGAQGGDVKSLRGLLNSKGTGIFINSSRGILYPQYPKTGEHWLMAIEKSAVDLKNRLNAEKRVL